jgi:cell surface protein SprA
LLKSSQYILFCIGFSVLSLASWLVYGAEIKPVKLGWTDQAPEDSTKKKVDRSKPNFIPKDRQGDPYSNPSSESPLLLDNPSNITQEVTMDSVNGTFTITEKVGDMDFRTPSTMTFDEYMKHRDREMLKNYWNNKNSGTSEVKDKDASEASLKIPAPGIGSIFGKDFVEIKPNGSVTLDFAGKWQRTRNPNVPVRNQRTGGFEFDQQISLNIIGTIGDKLKLTANWDTKASFDFQNNLKLQYTGYEEDIIQSIEAGNVSFPVNSSLISGSQNLFGVKTNLRFGRLKVSAVASTQRGKKEEMKIKGGSLTREINFRADNYDEYRNFFLAHFFRNNYEASLKNLPAIISGVKITRVDVYVTNTNNNTQNNRTIIAYTDLGESDSTLYNRTFRNQSRQVPASNDEAGTYNTLYQSVKDRRNTEVLPAELEQFNMVNGSDYVIINNARKLDPSEYRFHPELGYISLNTNIRLNEVISVAYQYSYNGSNYTVGEIPGINNPDTTSNSPLILKMLKPNNVNTRLTTWDLMMKNVYQLGSSQITAENFKLDIFYKNDQSGADLPFFQEGRRTNRKLLLRLTGLDRLGPNNDPPGDGNFDYIEGVTIDSRYGKIIFPVLEPFGSNIEQYFDADEQALKNQYVFSELYDSTKSDMLNYARKNKYYIKGQYQGSNSSTLYLSGINLSPGSVVVSQGANTLTEGSDYEINYQTGQLRILNQGLLESGQEVSIRYESADLFNFRRKSFFGTRFDYEVNKNFNLGATLLHQSEAPQITRVTLGDEPSKNTIAGVDVSFTKDSRFITKAVDKLPIIQTKAPSTISFQAEGAGLFPGHSKAINKGGNKGGVSYIDDFEGARTPYDLTRSPISWKLSSTPVRFPESAASGIEYTYNRAKLAWYNVDQLFYTGSNANKPKNVSDEDIKNHFIRQVMPQEIFPYRQELQLMVNEPVLNLAYYPAERGPYNYNPALDADGKLPNPTQNWGGVTRAITSDIDFDQSNIQYIEFWMMSPYIKSNKNYTDIEPGIPFDTTNRGRLYFNLGSISEDIMKDNKHAFENGLPATKADQNDVSKFTENEWGRVTKQTFLTNAFDNSDGSRPLQDVGLDGLNSEMEGEKFANFLNQINLNISNTAYSAILSDPSADDFRYYLDTEYDNQNATILQRYKNYNGMENNSPVNSTDGVAVKSNSSLPDNEDINNDNNVDILNEYYEYEIDIDPSKFKIGENYIVDKNVVTDSRYTNGDEVTWYQFRIPIREFDGKTGNINGFKSIKFMRMYMTGFESPVILRMAQMQLVANQWRVYLNDLDEPGIGPPKVEPSKPNIVVSTVNIEENGVGDADNIPYKVPPGYDRDQDITSQINRELNEQSLQICVDNLGEGQSRSAFKYLDGMNLLNYKRIKMFLSAQSKEFLPDSAATAFLRLGTDFEDNYYEIEVPLHYSEKGRSFTSEDVWRSENRIDVSLDDLVSVKLERNESSGGQINYRAVYSSERGGRRINVVGNPNLSVVQTIMLGLKNPFAGTVNSSIQTCVWANELLVSDFIESAGYAATASLNMQLADLATVTSSIRYIGAGFGSLEQKVSERALENTLQYSIGSNIALDKFVPAKIGLKLPFYVGHDKKMIIPKYDPLNGDVKLYESIRTKPEGLRDSYRSKVIDETTTNSWNFTNIRKVKTKPGSKSRIYDIENLAISFGVIHQKRNNASMQEYDYKNWKGGIGYTYNNNAKVYEPFKNMKSKSPYLKAIKDFNFSLMPSTISVRTDLERRVTKTVYYAGSPLYDILQDPIYSKSFTNNRNYGLNWNFTRNLTADFSASTFSVIDEPDDSLTPGSKVYNEALWEETKKFGRMKNYNQAASLNYKVPLDKFPLTNWLGADTRYSSGYTWSAGALDLQDTLGNAISNKQDMSVNGRINLDKLYTKVPALKKILNERPQAQRPPFGPQAKLPTQNTDAKDSTKKEKPPREMKALKQAIRSVLSMKVINANYTLSRGTSLAGYLPGVDYMGIENGQTNMLPYVFGSQDASILTRLTDEGKYSTSASLNTPFTQFRNENINIRTSLEPVRDFRIQLDMVKTRSVNYEEIYRFRPDSATQISDWFSDAPNLRGNYNVSFIAIATAFKKDNKDNSSEAFRNFESYLADIQRRKPNGNKFNRNSHEIMIPALIAAYSGKSVDEVKLTSFPKIPLPNWRVDYNGLTRMKKISKWFSLLSLSHGYQSTFTISNLTSSLEYSDNPAVISPGKDFTKDIDTKYLLEKDGKYISPYIIDQVVISEKFSPLLGVNFRTKTKIEGRLEYVRDRTVALSMSNSQIQEIKNNGIVLGLGYAKAGIKLPIASGGNPTTVLKNEVKFRVDFAIKNGKTVQHRINEGSTTTAGNLNWQLKPTINYLVNQRVNLTLYFERTVNEPKISSSFKRSTTAFGIQLRFTLS